MLISVLGKNSLDINAHFSILLYLMAIGAKEWDMIDKRWVKDDISFSNIIQKV